jgi:hypothetical protein
MKRTIKGAVAGALAAFVASSPNNAEAAVAAEPQLSRETVSAAAREKIGAKADELRLAATKKKKSPTFGDSKFNKSKFARVTTPGPSFVQAQPPKAEPRPRPGR